MSALDRVAMALAMMPGLMSVDFWLRKGDSFIFRLLVSLVSD